MAETRASLAEKQYLELSDFEGLVNEKFTISPEGSDASIEAELIDAKYIKSDTNIDRKPFCLDFKLPTGNRLAQGTYQLYNESIGAALAFFLVPYQEDESGYYMTSGFN